MASLITDQQDLVKRFTLIDYGVFASMLGMSAVIGIYYAFSGGRQSTTSEFLMGNRSLGVFPVAMSVMASFVSAIALLGIPAETYIYGLQNFSIIFCLPFVMIIAAYAFMPVFYNLGVTSSYEYLEKRFSRSVRIMGSLLFAVNMIFYMSIVLYAPSLALSQVTGLGVWFSVLSTGIVCTFYTTIGGMKAVVWTDVFQTSLMILMMFTIVVKGIIDLGGFQVIWDINQQFDRIELFNMNPDPFERHTFWTVSIGSFFVWVSIYGTNQTMIQRYLSIPTLKQAQKTVWIVLPLKVTIIGLACMAGCVIFAKYHDCDPLSTKRVVAADQLFPLFVMDSLGSIPGFPGLFVSGVFSGALSTISSGVNALAAVTLEDFIKPYASSKLSESKATIITKSVAVLFGFVAIGLVAVAQSMGNVLQAAIAIFGLLGSPVFALFVLGMCIPMANSKGAFWGTIIGIITSLWIGIGAMIYKPFHLKKPISVDYCIDLYVNITKSNYTVETFGFPTDEEINRNSHIPLVYQISYQYYSVIGVIITLVAGCIISYFTGRSSIADYDSNLFIPLIANIVKQKQQKKINNYIDKFGPEKANSIVATALGKDVLINCNGRPMTYDVSKAGNKMSNDAKSISIKHLNRINGELNKGFADDNNHVTKF